MAKISKEEYEILKGLEVWWKWIARDGKGDDGGNLFAYSEKPFKIYDVGEWDCGMDILFIGTHLFQFIQWGDGQPFRIAELIEEYESEKTEVKRNLKEAILGIEVTQFDGYKADLEEFVNPRQLEEIIDDWMPEVLLPVIPQFVANWIEGNKQFEEKWNDYSKEDAMNDTIHFTIYGLFADPATNSDVELRKPVLKWLSDDRGNYFKLVNAVRYRYELEEEEPKFYALIKGHENISSDDKYWNYCITDESLDIGDSKVHADVLDKYVLNATKDEWANLGINDDNADFVLVEELEE